MDTVRTGVVVCGRLSVRMDDVGREPTSEPLHKVAVTRQLLINRNFTDYPTDSAVIVVVPA